MKIIRVDRIGDYERRIEVEFDGGNPTQYRDAVEVIFEAGDLTVEINADTETSGGS